MTLAYSKQIPPAGAGVFCNALMAGIAFRRMLNALKDGDRVNGCESYYDNRKRGIQIKMEKTGNATFDLSQSAVVIFSTDKAALKRSLERSNATITIPSGSLAVVKNNYSGLGLQIPTYATLPLLALLKALQINGKAAGNRLATAMNNKFGTEFDDNGNRTMVNPLQTGGSLLMANRLRSGYYVLLAQSGDLVNNINLNSDRVYTLPTQQFDTKHISTLISS